MAQLALRCNGSAVPECVFDDANLAQRIHKSDIKPNIRKGPIGHLAQIFLCAGIQTFHLARANARCCAVKITALLHFDENQSIAIMRDQINLTAFATPTALRDWKTTAFVIC